MSFFTRVLRSTGSGNASFAGRRPFYTLWSPNFTSNEYFHKKFNRTVSAGFAAAILAAIGYKSWCNKEAREVRRENMMYEAHAANVNVQYATKLLAKREEEGDEDAINQAKANLEEAIKFAQLHAQRLEKFGIPQPPQ